MAGYVSAVAAGAAASAQLWLHALDVPEALPPDRAALPRARERAVPAVVLPPLVRHAPRPSVASTFPGLPAFFPVPGRGPLTIAISVPVPAVPTKPAAGPRPVPQPPPGPAQPSPPAPTAPEAIAAPATQAPTATHGPTTAPPQPPAARPSAGGTRPSPSRDRAVRAVPATRARPPAAVPATRATPAVPPSNASAAKQKHENKPAKPKKSDHSVEQPAPAAVEQPAPAAAASSQPPSGAPAGPPPHAEDNGGHGQGNGRGHDK